MIRYVGIAYPSVDKIAALKTACASFGAKIRVRKLSGSQHNRVRIVITSGTHEMVRNACIEQGMLYLDARPFTLPDWRRAWQDQEIVAFWPVPANAPTA